MNHHRPRPRLLEPSRIRPVAVDLRRVFWAGIALWTVALVITVVGWFGDTVTGRSVATCVAGILLGLAALVWERRRRRSQAGTAAAEVQPGRPDGPA